MKYRGRIHTFEDHIDTDAIIPAEYLASTDTNHLASGCFAKAYPQFRDSVRPGDLIFAGENFGCGSSREHAPMAIKAVGIACVVAARFSRVFYRSAINIGLPVAVCPAAIGHAREGGEAEVDFDEGLLRLAGQEVSFQAFSAQVLSILQAGGLVAYMRQRIASEASAS